MSSTIEFSPEIAAKTPGAFVKQGEICYRYVDKPPAGSADVSIYAPDLFVPFGVWDYSVWLPVGFKLFVTEETGRPGIQVASKAVEIAKPGYSSVRLAPSGEGYYEVGIQPNLTYGEVRTVIGKLFKETVEVGATFFTKLRQSFTKLDVNDEEKVVALIKAELGLTPKRRTAAEIVLRELKKRRPTSAVRLAIDFKTLGLPCELA